MGYEADTRHRDGEGLEHLKGYGLIEEEVWSMVEIASMCNFTSRMSLACDMLASISYLRVSNETEWTVNPLLMAGTLYTSKVGIKDLVEAINQLASDLNRVVSYHRNELQASTESECQQRQD